MASTIKWSAALTARGSVLSTEMNSLAASGGKTNAGSEINNSSNLDSYAWLEFYTGGFGTAPTAGTTLDVYMLRAIDDTNYEDGSSSVTPHPPAFVCSLPVNNTTSAQRIVSRMFTIDPSKVKFLLINNTNQALPSSGNTLKLFTTNLGTT